MTESREDANQHDADPRQNGEHVDDLVEVYALGALDEQEQRRVARHLATCDDCRQRIDDVDRVTTWLPFMSPPVPRPSPAAKMALMARVHQQQEHAQPAVIAAPDPGSTNAAAPAAVRRFTMPRWGMTLMPAALAVLLVSSLVWSYTLSHRLTRAENQRATFATQLTWLYGGQSGAQIYAFQPMSQNSQAGGRLCVDNQNTTAMVVAWALDPSQRHVLWAMNPDGSKSMLMPLNVSPTGSVVQMLTLNAGYNGTTTLVIATDGPGASTELMLQPTPAPASATPETPTATSWPYYIHPVPVAY